MYLRITVSVMVNVEEHKAKYVAVKTTRQNVDDSLRLSDLQQMVGDECSNVKELNPKMNIYGKGTLEISG